MASQSSAMPPQILQARDPRVSVWLLRRGRSRKVVEDRGDGEALDPRHPRPSRAEQDPPKPSHGVKQRQVRKSQERGWWLGVRNRGDSRLFEVDFGDRIPLNPTDA